MDVKIQAHRGASKIRPENTLCAFQKAIDLHADGIELDVYLISDGSLVVHHDTQLKRCGGDGQNIYDMDADSLRGIDVGAYFGSAYKHERIPFLREVLELLRGTDLLLNVEIKKAVDFLTPVVEKVVGLMDEYQMRERCILSSFHHDLLAEIKQTHPDYRVGALYSEPPRGLDIVSYCKQYGFDAIHPWHQRLSGQLVEACHQNGIAVNAWTADDPDAIERLLSLSVDTIITNDVETAMQVAGRGR